MRKFKKKKQNFISANILRIEKSARIKGIEGMPDYCEYVLTVESKSRFVINFAINEDFPYFVGDRVFFRYNTYGKTNKIQKTSFSKIVQDRDGFNLSEKV